MEISTALAAAFASLTEALGRADVDMERQVLAFTADVSIAVTSYLGMTMTITAGDDEVSFTLGEHTATRTATSLLVPFSVLSAALVGGTVVLYAATPGAFVDLTADLAYALGLGPAALVLDEHLAAPAGSVGFIGLDDQMTINQAIGVLIERGYPPDEAREVLRRRADLHGADIRGAAAQILRGITDGRPDSRDGRPSP